MFSDLNEEEALYAINKLGLSAEMIDKWYPRIFEPLGKPSQLKLTPREFFYWTDKGVIDIPKSEEGQSPWSRLNLLEILWIRILKELREFNLPFDPLKVLKKDMFCNILDVMKDNQQLTLNEIKKRHNDPVVIKYFTEILNLSDKNSEKLRNEYKYLFSLITGTVAEILFYKRNISLIVYKTHKKFAFILEGFKNQDMVIKEIEEAKKGTHMILSLNKIVAEYLLEPELEQLNEEFGFVSEEEKEIIKYIRDKQVKEINIRKGDNEEITFTATSKKEIKDSQVNDIKRLLRMNEFDDVRVVLRNDKHLYIENKKKIKIRPVDTAQKKNKN